MGRSGNRFFLALAISLPESLCIIMPKISKVKPTLSHELLVIIVSYQCIIDKFNHMKYNALSLWWNLGSLIAQVVNSGWCHSERGLGVAPHRLRKC